MYCQPHSLIKKSLHTSIMGFSSRLCGPLPGSERPHLSSTCCRCIPPGWRLLHVVSNRCVTSLVVQESLITPPTLSRCCTFPMYSNNIGCFFSIFVHAMKTAVFISTVVNKNQITVIATVIFSKERFTVPLGGACGPLVQVAVTIYMYAAACASLKGGLDLISDFPCVTYLPIKLCAASLSKHIYSSISISHICFWRTHLQGNGHRT